jgi:hypothetical protein
MYLPMDTGAFWAHERIGIMSRLANMDTFSLNMDSLVCDSVKRDTIRLVFTRVPGWLKIQLDRPLPIGESLDVDIFYHRDPGTPGNGFIWASARSTHGHAEAYSYPFYSFSIPVGSRCWFPCFDEVWDKAERGCMINLTVPDSFTACANGKLDSISTNPSARTKTFWWDFRYGIVTYHMAFAVSKYVTWSQHVVRAPGDTVEIQYYIWPEDSAISDTGFRYVPDIMSFYIQPDRFADYPFEKLKTVTLATNGFYSLPTILYWPRSFGPDSSSMAHEMAHQWWGSMVTIYSWANVWLNEGFATYSGFLYMEHREGHSRLLSDMAGCADGFFYSDSVQRYPLYNPPFLWGISYSKGAWVQHMLRYVENDTSATPGLFFTALRAYADSMKSTNASTADYQRIHERITGQNLTQFFDEWVYQAGYPQYTVNWFGAPESSNWRIKVDITQNNGPGAPPVFHMPVEFLFHLTGKDTLVHYPINTSPQHNEFVVSARPDSAVFDPGYWILKKFRMTNVGVETEEGGDKISPFALSPNTPNPFCQNTSIAFSLSRNGQASLAVFDVLGQKIRTLLNGQEKAGSHEIIWDGRSDLGREMPSGIYFYRLEAGGQTRTRKALKIR